MAKGAASAEARSASRATQPIPATAGAKRTSAKQREINAHEVQR
jgi:hypothetical protein